jgi:hypothetical protein
VIGHGLDSRTADSGIQALSPALSNKFVASHLKRPATVAVLTVSAYKVENEATGNLPVDIRCACGVLSS